MGVPSATPMPVVGGGLDLSWVLFGQVVAHIANRTVWGHLQTARIVTDPVGLAAAIHWAYLEPAPSLSGKVSKSLSNALLGKI